MRRRQTPYHRSHGPSSPPGATRPTIVQQRATVGVYGHVSLFPPHGSEAGRVGEIDAGPLPGPRERSLEGNEIGEVNVTIAVEIGR